MVRTKLKMNTDLKDAFSEIKPVCDMLMLCPSLESLTRYSIQVTKLKKEVVQELQQYLLYPLIARIKWSEILALPLGNVPEIGNRRKIIHQKVLETILSVLEKITINSYEMYMKLETGLLSIIFDTTKPGMDSSEEIKLSTVQCLTMLMVNIPQEFRVKLLKNQVPMLAQAVFVCVHIAKLERFRPLRLAAIECVTAHTMTHPQITVDYHIPNPELELLAVDNMLAGILPGVLGALQDVCVCTNNPNHAVIATSIDAIHRILCLPMNDKYLAKKPVTTEDFVNMLKEKKAKCDPEVSNKAQKSPRDMVKRSDEWFAMAGEKLTLITKSLVSLRVYDHYKVRKELAIFCYRILMECSTTMSHSIPLCLDVLISLSKDEYPEVATYCSSAVNTYFTNAPEHAKHKTMDSLCSRFISLSISLPRVLNNIDEARKLSELNLLHGYAQALCSGRPQRLTAALSVASNMQHLCGALAAAARHDARAARRSRRAAADARVEGGAGGAPWSVLARLPAAGAARLRGTCGVLGGAECAELVLDVLLHGFRQKLDCETVYILNAMIASPDSTTSMAKRMLYAYLEQEVWFLPLEVGAAAAPPDAGETLDVTVYDPHAWHEDSVPDLYEGKVETRYTDISYQTPRTPAPRDPRYCATLGEAQRNLVLSCLLTEGVGAIATRLQAGFQPYQLKTLCLILERVGSPYELLHLAGLKAINQIAQACGLASVGDLINQNADYFTHQISIKLKKAWDCQSALQILSVVMEYSDARILNCLYGIVEDVLVQSCDKYYEKEVHLFLQAFVAFVGFLRRWVPAAPRAPPAPPRAPHLLAELREYVKDTQEAERLLSDSDFEKSSGKSVEEMYKEDMKKKEEEELDYDDQVTNENEPPPRHAAVTVAVLRRCVHFIPAAEALRALRRGLPLLPDDELLPLVHRAWAPLAAAFRSRRAAVLRRALRLLLAVAALSRDFVRNRTVREVLPEVYEYLKKSAKDSYLKDAGSAYRNSQAYSLQLTALDALPSLAVDLGLEDERLTDAMACVEVYLSNKQPKPLQASAVKFFKIILDNDYAAGWYHLRKFCDNDIVLEPPKLQYMKLEPIIGTPFQPKDKDFETNIKLIFDSVVS